MFFEINRKWLKIFHIFLLLVLFSVTILNIRQMHQGAERVRKGERSPSRDTRRCRSSAKWKRCRTITCDFHGPTMALSATFCPCRTRGPRIKGSWVCWSTHPAPIPITARWLAGRATASDGKGHPVYSTSYLLVSLIALLIMSLSSSRIYFTTRSEISLIK